MQLAFYTYAGAVEDARGRALNGQPERTKRNNAALALRWLRAGLRPGPLQPFSVRWCAHILSVDPKWLVQTGVQRLPLSGLTYWRQWKAEFGKNRQTKKPVTLRTCAHCGREMQLKSCQKARQFCTPRCTIAHRMSRKPKVDTYKSYQRFCRAVGCIPLTQTQWSILCG